MSTVAMFTTGSRTLYLPFEKECCVSSYTANTVTVLLKGVKGKKYNYAIGSIPVIFGLSSR